MNTSTVSNMLSLAARSGHVRSGQVRSGQVRSGQVRVLTAGSHDGQHLAGPDEARYAGQDLPSAGRAGDILELQVDGPLLADGRKLRSQLRPEGTEERVGQSQYGRGVSRSVTVRERYL